MWVRSEYAGELAVLSAWLCSLMPWVVTYIPAGTQIRIHFPYVFVQFTPTLANFRAFSVFVHEGPGGAAAAATATAYQLWGVGAVVLTLALALSIVYYVYEERLEAKAPVDPVRVMGVLLVGAGVPLAVGCYYLWVGLAVFTIPVGVLFMFFLGGSLLAVERT
ncbi:hypothetical protein HWV23_14960 [Natronomonas halophila]|uniref:DUF7549 family protein n=1 Tax=Natronomonas halophila TaxID=2747817 RepID=UPI0015B60FA3|nr:hypothetical protein [Natronomonas halophila]QLD86970.1 hypothetical protein HWV23_14960 [Natronomonas halophila]